MSAVKQAAATAASSTISEEEVRLIEDSIILPAVIKTIERNADEIKLAGWTLVDIYVRVSGVMAAIINDELAQTRRTLSRQNIVVYKTPISVVDGTARYRYRTRGQEGLLVLTRDYVKGEISRRIEEYTAAIFKR